MPRILICLFLLLAWTLPAHAQPRHVFLVGDSTVAEYGPERAPQAGWGQMLQSYLDPQAWQAHNHAKGGRSARSFIAEGRLDAVAAKLQRGDVLMIQFGHNDAKFEDPTRYDDPDTDYPAFLLRYVALAREKGATPVLITPPARLLYDFGSLLDTHGLYTRAMQRLAAREQVALIDLNASSSAWIRALGEQAARPYFLFVPEQGKADGTHFSVAGATAMACLVVRGWIAVDPDVRGSLVRDIDCDIPADATNRRAMQAQPSAIEHEADRAVEQPGPHAGAGRTTAYPFFADAKELPFVLRKRVLHRGAGIGLHLHDKDEIYYIVSGSGLYALDGRQYQVGPGDALLTRPGSTHALQQQGADDLVILLGYPGRTVAELP